MMVAQFAILLSATVASFLWFVYLKGKCEGWVIDYVSSGIMIGFVAVGLGTLLASGDPGVVVFFIWGYAPHAYNLVIWPVLALLVLRPRFGPRRFLLALVFTYGLDEVIWNSVADAYLGDAGRLGYTTIYWQVFFISILAGVFVSYVLVRPRIVPNWTWGFFAAFLFVYTVVARLPTYANIGSSPYWYIYAWELTWQSVVWLLIYRTFWPRTSPFPNWAAPRYESRLGSAALPASRPNGPLSQAKGRVPSFTSMPSSALDVDSTGTSEFEVFDAVLTKAVSGAIAGFPSFKAKAPGRLGCPHKSPSGEHT